MTSAFLRPAATRGLAIASLATLHATTLGSDAFSSGGGTLRPLVPASKKMKILALSLLGLAALAAPLPAQSVDFLRTVAIPDGSTLPFIPGYPILPQTTNPTLSSETYIITMSGYMVLDQSTGLWTGLAYLGTFNLNELTSVAISADGSHFAFINAQGTLYDHEFATFKTTGYRFDINHLYLQRVSTYIDGHVLVANNRGEIWDLNYPGIAETKLFSIPFTSTLSLRAPTVRYAPDGSLWVLNDARTSLLNFTSADGVWAQTSSFDLTMPSDGTLAITADGGFVFGDGLGGGSLYSASGDLLQTFSGGAMTASTRPGTSTSYVTANADGLINIFSALRDGSGSYTVFNQYQLIPAVPEPSTCALAIGALLGLIVLRHRRMVL